jgi:two-component system, NarL family, nitrate/nitrite response regulator NarL
VTEQPVRILIADDHPIFRAGLRQLLETDPRSRVVGEAIDGAEAVKRVAELQPELLLLDLAMPHMDGLAVLHELERQGISVRTVMLTAEIEPTQVVDCLKHGAAGVLLKSAATELLFRCIGAVMDGQYWVDRGTTGDLVGALRQYEAADAGQPGATLELTPRERDILAALLKGESNKVIARELGIAEQTVKNQLSHLYEKFGVSSRLELVVSARERGLDGHAWSRQRRGS